MSGVVLGALVGAGAGAGTWLSLRRVRAIRGSAFQQRVLVPLRLGDASGSADGGQRLGPWGQLVAPALSAGARHLERVLGGSASVRRRLDRAGLADSVHDFRVQQLLWGAVGLAAAGSLSVLVVLRSPDRLVPLALLTLVAGLGGVLLRDHRLSAQVASHELRVLAELPAVAELLALSVAAGEGPVGALERVVARSRGALSAELAVVLAEIRTGAPVATAFDDYAARTGLPVVARFASGVAVAVERGTPLADVLHAQAADVREAQRRALIEAGSRREIAMMLPVVFLVLPTTVLFAFWPGVIGLRMVTS